MVIDACRPWERLDTFPPVVTPSTELKKKVIKKWKDLFPQDKTTGYFGKEGK
jgi:hypothetical protein